MDLPDIMTIEEVAGYLRVSERTVYDWAQKGEIPCGKLGTSWRFKRDEIQRWVDEKLGTRDRRQAENVLTIREVLSEERVVMLDTSTKRDALDAMIKVLATAPTIRSEEELAREVYRRETLMSTGIGGGIAVPHVRLDTVHDITMAAGVSRVDITDYDAIDGQPVRIILMVAAGRHQHAQYLRTLASVSSRLRDDTVRERVLAAQAPQEVYDLLAGNEF